MAANPESLESKFSHIEAFDKGLAMENIWSAIGAIAVALIAVAIQRPDSYQRLATAFSVVAIGSVAFSLGVYATKWEFGSTLMSGFAKIEGMTPATLLAASQLIGQPNLWTDALPAIVLAAVHFGLMMFVVNSATSANERA